MKFITLSETMSQEELGFKAKLSECKGVPVHGREVVTR